MADEEVIGRAGPRVRGRADEVAEVVDVLVSAIDGEGALALLCGEPGVGKSHALAEVVEDADAKPWHVLRIEPAERDHLVPFAALARSFAKFAAPPSASGAHDELRAALEPPVEPSSARAAAAGFLAAMRADAPTLVTVDDIHLLDDLTIALLDDGMRRGDTQPLTILGTLPAGTTAAGAALHSFAAAAAQRGWRRARRLEPMSADDVAALVEERLGLPPDPALVAFVHRQSAGNPFFALRLLRDLDEKQAILRDHAAAQLVATPGVPSAACVGDVLDRMLGGRPETRMLEHALALLAPARVARVELAAQMATIDAAEAAASFDCLVEQSLIEVQEGDRFDFRHELVHECLRCELGPARRRRWHRLAAERLAALPASAVLDAERARHLRHVAEPGDEAALALLSRVAERTSRLDPAASVTWYEAALALVGPEHAARLELTAHLARALFLAGEPRKAADFGLVALEQLASDEPQREQVTGMVLDALGQVSVEEAAALLDAERANGTSMSRLGSRAAHAYAIAGRLADAEHEAERFRRELTGMSPSERVNALSDLMHMRSITQGYAPLARLLDELRSAAADAPPPAQLRAYAAMSLRLALQGETNGCMEMLARAHELADQVGGDSRNAELVLAEVFNAFNIGDWDLALETAGAILPRLTEAGSHSYVTVLRGVEIELLANRGEWAVARLLADEEPPGHPTFAAIHVAAQAELDLMSGDLPLARGRLEDQLAQDRLPWPLRTPLLSRLADVEIEAGDLSAARRVLAELEGHDARELDHSSFVRFRLAEGRAARAVEPLREALAVADEHGLALLRGRARLHLAQLEEAAAERCLREAMPIFQALEATPWRRRVAAELRARGLKVPRRRSTPDGALTEGETQIARLVQQGRTNGEIAVTVSLSVKTVQAYLTRIYGKTGCANRLELARALDAGLLDEPTLAPERSVEGAPA